MLKMWRIKRFKPIDDSGELELAGLTVLSGQNSSGKSSILQSILMVAQTLSNPIADRPLIINGLFLQLGQFKDILKNKSRNKTIELDFELDLDQIVPIDRAPSRKPRESLNDTVKVSAKFSGLIPNKQTVSSDQASKISLKSIKLETRSLLYQMELFPEENNPKNLHQLNIAEMDQTLRGTFFSNVIPDNIYKSLFGDDDKTYFVKVDKGGQKKEYLVSLSHFIPRRFYGKYSLVERKKREYERYFSDLFERRVNLREMTSFPKTTRSTALNKEIQDIELDSDFKQNFFDLLNKLEISPSFEGDKLLDLFKWLQKIQLLHLRRNTISAYRLILALITEEYLKHEELPNSSDEGIEIISFENPELEVWQRISDYIAKYFTRRIRYLGPLRADPQVAQRFSPSSEVDDVGIRGEYAAYVYDTNQNNFVEYYNPYESHINKDKLKNALDNWVKYLNVGERVQIEVAGQTGVIWQIIPKQGNAPLPLTAVGVGVSQILPILVMGLLAPKGTLLIVEQPELHLHPRVQSRLGDFLVGLVKCGKQCLVETHSENLINQLRLHIVQAGGQEKVTALYILPSKMTQALPLLKKSKFHQMALSKTGLKGSLMKP